MYSIFVTALQVKAIFLMLQLHYVGLSKFKLTVNWGMCYIIIISKPPLCSWSETVISFLNLHQISTDFLQQRLVGIVHFHSLPWCLQPQRKKTARRLVTTR